MWKILYFFRLPYVFFSFEVYISSFHCSSILCNFRLSLIQTLLLTITRWHDRACTERIIWIYIGFQLVVVNLYMHFCIWKRDQQPFKSSDEKCEVACNLMIWRFIVLDALLVQLPDPSPAGQPLPGREAHKQVGPQSRLSARLFLQLFDPPSPHPKANVSPLLFRGNTLACGRGGGGRVPIRTRGQTMWYSRYTVYVLYGWFSYLKEVKKKN